MTKNRTSAIYVALASAVVLGSTQVQAQIGNSAYGDFALNANTGDFNTAFGDHVLYSNTTASNNTGIGQASLYYNTTGNNNTGSGIFLYGLTPPVKTTQPAALHR